MTKERVILEGIGVGNQAAVGEALWWHAKKLRPSSEKHSGNQSAERLALLSAIESVSVDLRALMAQTDKASAEILQSLDLILRDESLINSAFEQISLGFEAGTAFVKAISGVVEQFRSEPVFEERIVDIVDLGRRVMSHVQGFEEVNDLPKAGSFVLMGEDFTTADTARFTAAVSAVVTLAGGITSHMAIVCRARSIPLVVGCVNADQVVDGQRILVDPVGNRVIIGGELSDATAAAVFSPTQSNSLIPVMSNVGSFAEAIASSTADAAGVGLVRTELLFEQFTEKPSLAQQQGIYAEIFSACPDGPIIARTLDIAIDKSIPFFPAFDSHQEAGLRTELLEEFLGEQLLALEAARKLTAREVWVMAPMIQSEKQARDFLFRAREAGAFKLGIMVETAGAIELIGELAGEIDFVSVGTNDLAADLFGVSRLDAHGQRLLDHWQPALISALADIARYSSQAGIHSGVCGESASDPSFSIVLAGLGFDSVSASPSQVGQVRAALSSVDKEQAAQVASAALAGLSADESKSLALSKLAGFQG